MGAALRLPLGETLRRQVLENQYIFSTVTDRARAFRGFSGLAIKTGDGESQVRLTKEGGLTVAVFTYALDNDSDPDNGRIYVHDRFVFDPARKKLIEPHRSFSLKGPSEGPWGRLHQRLVEKVPPLSADPAGTDRFFRKVVLEIPDFLESEPAPSSLNLPLLSLRPSPHGGSSPAAPRNLLFRVRGTPSVARFQGETQAGVHRLLSGFFDGLVSPLLVGSMFAGGAAFHWAEAAVLSRFGGHGARSLFLATSAGVAAEAPVFGLAERSLRRSFLQETRAVSSREVFQNFLSFGALRGAGLGLRLSLAAAPDLGLLYGRMSLPVLHHGASFGALHSVHELERAHGALEASAPWPSRMMEDGLFYLQAGLSGHLAQGALGPRFASKSCELRSAEELKFKMERVSDTQWQALRLRSEVEKNREWEARFARLQERAERVLEIAEADARKILLLQSLASEAADRAETYKAETEILKAKLQKNKFGTEKVIEWARLKEKENAGIRASLEDALRQIESFSAEASLLKADLREMTAEFVRRDQEATALERELVQAGEVKLSLEEAHTSLSERLRIAEDQLASYRARYGSEVPPRISTIVLRGPDPEVAGQKDK